MIYILFIFLLTTAIQCAVPSKNLDGGGTAKLVGYISVPALFFGAMVGAYISMGSIELFSLALSVGFGIKAFATGLRVAIAQWCGYTPITAQWWMLLTFETIGSLGAIIGIYFPILTL